MELLLVMTMMMMWVEQLEVVRGGMVVTISYKLESQYNTIKCNMALAYGGIYLYIFCKCKLMTVERVRSLLKEKNNKYA